MRRRFALVFNKRAGVAWPGLLTRTLAAVRAAGAEIVELDTKSAEDATRQVAELARSGGFDAVIAAGGDGTIRAVAAGAAGTALAVGIIPLGTGNVMKYEIGLRARSKDIAETLLNGSDVEVQGGTVNGAPFFLMVGAGYDARIVAALRQGTKRLLGRAAYGGPILKTLARGPDDLDVVVDGVPCKASWAIISNASRYGGSFKLTNATQLGSQGLVAVLIEGKTRRSLLAASLALALGRLAHDERRPKNITVIRARQVHISSRHGAVPVEIDGDEGGTTPVVIEAAGARVRLIVPPAYVADLTNRHANHLPSDP